MKHGSSAIAALAVTVVIALGTAVVAMAGSFAGSHRAAPTGGHEGRGRALHVLVTNDDGVAAPGIDAVVEALRALRNVDVTVVAPATNQSGTGDRFSTAPLTVTSTTTASGYPATAVSGFPADTVLYAVHGLHLHPDLVVSGINFGQNVAELANVSGTVGAALWAARLGIPAIAASQALPATTYSVGAAEVAGLVMKDFMHYLHPTPRWRTVTNVNIPTCTTGAPRGSVNVPLGRITSVTGYTGSGTVTPVVTSRNFTTIDCASTLRHPVDDVAALTNGFISVSTLSPDLTAPTPRHAATRPM